MSCSRQKAGPLPEGHGLGSRTIHLAFLVGLKVCQNNAADDGNHREDCLLVLVQTL